MKLQFLQKKSSLLSLFFCSFPRFFISVARLKNLRGLNFGILGLTVVGSVLFFGSHSQAASGRSTTVVGRGTASGFCTDHLSSFCIDNIERSAKSNGQSDADMQCRMQNGRSITYTAHCNTWCSPMSIPPGPGQTYVSCNANCNMQCEL